MTSSHRYLRVFIDVRFLLLNALDLCVSLVCTRVTKSTQYENPRNFSCGLMELMLVCCQTIKARGMRITKVSVIEQVIKELQSLISSGDYLVGDKLPPELELCKDMGVSRSTVREAYRMLNAYGLVEIRPGRGAFVKQLSRDANHKSVRDWFIENEAELLELMEVRMAIEPIAVRLAIKRATEQQISIISDLHDRFKEAARLNDALELATLDEAFHTAIVEGSNNRLLTKLNRLLVEEFREYRTKAFSVEENVAHALPPHEAIVQAIHTHDTAAAIEATNRHLITSLEDIENVVKEL